jgi:hypothetical protein
MTEQQFVIKFVLIFPSYLYLLILCWASFLPISKLHQNASVNTTQLPEFHNIFVLYSYGYSMGHSFKIPSFQSNFNLDQYIIATHTPIMSANKKLPMLKLFLYPVLLATGYGAFCYYY